MNRDENLEQLVCIRETLDSIRDKVDRLHELADSTNEDLQRLRRSATFPSE